MDNKGVIINRKRAKQLIDYSRVRFGNITPTDIDGFIDYRGECFVIIEYKLGNKALPPGQRRAFENLANNSVKPLLVIVAEHKVIDTEKDIEAGSCMVREAYWSGKWHKYQGKTVTELIRAWLGFAGSYGKGDKDGADG